MGWVAYGFLFLYIALVYDLCCVYALRAVCSVVLCCVLRVACALDRMFALAVSTCCTVLRIACWEYLVLHCVMYYDLVRVNCDCCSRKPLW